MLYCSYYKYHPETNIAQTFLEINTIIGDASRAKPSGDKDDLDTNSHPAINNTRTCSVKNITKTCLKPNCLEINTTQTCPEI